ncbi:MAG: outer membrane protein transport protein [Pseudomonadota bacterium]
MTKTLTTTAALLLTTTAVSAGGLDRATLSPGILFEDGRTVQLSFGSVQPDVTGSAATPAGALDSGNVGVDYTTFGTALKFDVDDKVSVAIIIDNPYGADVSYPAGTGYPLAGSEAAIDSTGITVLGKYQFNENVSAYFGPRAVTMDGFAQIVTAAGLYDATYAEDTAYGYVVGAAYERPDIALRVSLTYTSELEFSHDTTIVGVPDAAVENTEFTIPQSVNLEFQSGVAADTLVFGGVRWSEWTVTEINSFGFPGNPLVSYENDVITYSLGVGRKFTENFSAAVSVSYEEQQGGIASNLAPTDGSTSISLGGTYDFGNGLEVTGGVRYIMVGDAETELATPFGVLSPQFEDNSATAFGIQVAYKF